VVEPLEPFFFSAAYFVSTYLHMTFEPKQDLQSKRLVGCMMNKDASNQPFVKSPQQTMNHFKMVFVMCQQL
jgi:hypothetical protein